MTPLAANPASETENALRLLVDAQPGDFYPLKLLADHLRDNGGEEEAAALYEGLVGNHPDQAGILLSLAKCSSTLGDLPACKRHLERSLAIDPFNEIARESLAIINGMLSDVPSSDESCATPVPRCHFCGDQKLRVAFKYPDRDGGMVDIVTCPTCGSQQPDYGASPAGRKAKLELQSRHHIKVWPGLNPDEAIQLARDCAGVVDYYRPRIDAVPGDGAVVEIGAGRGGLVEAFRIAGFRVLACEPTAHLADLARNAYGFDSDTLQTADALDFIHALAPQRGRIKAVFMWHVLEHLDEPLDLLRGIAGLLAEGGCFIAQVPLLASEHIFPEHLSFLNEPAVHFAAQQCGLEVAETNYDGERKFMAMVLRKNSRIVPATAAKDDRFPDGRSLRFATDPHPRFHWHKHPHSDFVPPIYSFLDPTEWKLLENWFDETKRQNLIGESQVPFMSMLQGLVMGNRISRIVQLGTYSGYAALLLGFMLRRMGMKHALLSADIDPHSLGFTEAFVKRAGLDDCVKLALCDSKDPLLVADALAYFEGRPPQLVIIDSSHQMEQTLVELDLWYESLLPGGFMVLHDTGPYARQWDSTGKGGVQVAFDLWRSRNPGIQCLNIDCGASFLPDSPYFVYQDGCGIGIVYKGLAPTG